MAIEWPYDLLTPSSERAYLSGSAVMGGQSAGGISQAVRTDGGGLWIVEQSFIIYGVARMKAARALEALLDGGSAEVVVRLSEQGYQPSGLEGAMSEFSDGATFSDGSSFATVPPGATVKTAAALRATTVEIENIAAPLIGGERFSVTHTTKGRRLYQIRTVGAGEITFRPPLREAVSVGVELDFLRPGVTARLANAEEFIGTLTADRIAQATAVFVEAF